jgi:uncharacterized protein
MAAFSCAPYLGRDRAARLPVLACTRRDSPFQRFHSRPDASADGPASSLRVWPYRFCVMAVTLATRTCMRLRARLVGGLSSAAHEAPPSAALSLSYYYSRRGYLLLMELLTDEEGAMAVRLARQSIEHAVGGKSSPTPSFPPVFSEKRGVFVTLTLHDQLRGCIGFPEPIMALGKAIREAAIAAAQEDPRFTPVKPTELPIIRVEVTVLSVPVPLPGPPEVRPEKVLVGKHGLIAKGRGLSGLLLPQVATEYGWDSKTFLEHTCIKAGLPGRCWQDDQVRFSTFEGQIFHEPV